MRIYGLEDELIEQQEQEAAQMQTVEFDVDPVIVPAISGSNVSQSTFAWFE